MVACPSLRAICRLPSLGPSAHLMLAYSVPIACYRVLLEPWCSLGFPVLARVCCLNPAGVEPIRRLWTPCGPLVGSWVSHESGHLQFCTLKMSSLPVYLVYSSGQAGLCLPKAFSAMIGQAEVTSSDVVASALSAQCPGIQGQCTFREAQYGSGLPEA